MTSSLPTLCVTLARILKIPFNPPHFSPLPFILLPSSINSFPGVTSSKEPTCQENAGSIPGSGRSPWRREWQPTPVFLPGKFHGQRSLKGCSSRGHKESNRTQMTSFNLSFTIVWQKSSWSRRDFSPGLFGTKTTLSEGSLQTYQMEKVTRTFQRERRTCRKPQNTLEF